MKHFGIIKSLCVCVCVCVFGLDQMVFLPEACDYIADSKEQSVEMAESLDGDLVSRYRDTARQNQLWLSIGGFHQKVLILLEIWSCLWELSLQANMTHKKYHKHQTKK